MKRMKDKKSFGRRKPKTAPEPRPLPLIDAMRQLAERILAAQSPIENITCRLCATGDAVSVAVSMTSGMTAETAYKLPCRLKSSDFDPKAATDLVRTVLRTIP